MSELDWSLHNPELLRRNIALRKAHPDPQVPLHPGLCGPCADCAESIEHYIVHARKFGPGCVLETARASLADADLSMLELEINRIDVAKKTRQRRTTVDLAGQVAALADRGLIPAAIADTLNISDRRVANILSKSRTAPTGPDLPLNQAEKNAAKAEVHVNGHPAARNAQNGSYGVAVQLTLEVSTAA